MAIGLAAASRNLRMLILNMLSMRIIRGSLRQVDFFACNLLLEMHVFQEQFVLEDHVEVVFEVVKPVRGLVAHGVQAGCVLVQGCRSLFMDLIGLSSRLGDFHSILEYLLLTALILTLVVHIRLKTLFVLGSSWNLERNSLQAVVKWKLLSIDVLKIDVSVSK